MAICFQMRTLGAGWFSPEPLRFLRCGQHISVRAPLWTLFYSRDILRAPPRSLYSLSYQFLARAAEDSRIFSRSSRLQGFLSRFVLRLSTRVECRSRRVRHVGAATTASAMAPLRTIRNIKAVASNVQIIGHARRAGFSPISKLCRGASFAIGVWRDLARHVTPGRSSNFNSAQSAADQAPSLAGATISVGAAWPVGLGVTAARDSSERSTGIVAQRASRTERARAVNPSMAVSM